MKALQRLELLKDLVQQAVDRGATSVEAIHQQIAALPFEMLEKSGLLDDDRLRLREKQQRTIGTVYDAIRRINRQVGELISDQFELLEDGEHIKQVLDQKQTIKPDVPRRSSKPRTPAKPDKSVKPGKPATSAARTASKKSVAAKRTRRPR